VSQERSAKQRPKKADNFEAQSRVILENTQNDNTGGQLYSKVARNLSVAIGTTVKDDGFA
jgi:hypothetical protein